MSLYIRLFTGFWTNRKTMRLRASIGDAAFWVPPRLWCYAAENQPDGDFSNYSPAEIALLAHFGGDAEAMLEAMQQAGFMDGLKLHKWDEYNGYHTLFSQRASKAARARWKTTKKKRNEKKRKEKKRASIAPSIACASGCKRFAEFWLAYPKKKSKGAAERAWKKHDCDAFADTVLAKLALLVSSSEWKRDRGQFIPYPASWLNQKGWEDELLSGAAVSAAPWSLQS